MYLIPSSPFPSVAQNETKRAWRQGRPQGAAPTRKLPLVWIDLVPIDARFYLFGPELRQPVVGDDLGHVDLAGG